MLVLLEIEKIFGSPQLPVSVETARPRCVRFQRRSFPILTRNGPANRYGATARGQADRVATRLVAREDFSLHNATQLDFVELDRYAEFGGAGVQFDREVEGLGALDVRLRATHRAR